VFANPFAMPPDHVEDEKSSDHQISFGGDDAEDLFIADPIPGNDTFQVSSSSSPFE